MQQTNQQLSRCYSRKLNENMMEMGVGFQHYVLLSCAYVELIQSLKNSYAVLGLTPTPWAAFSIRNGGIGAGHDGAGHFFADGN